MEVVVFADDLRGTAEGHYPWDLGSKSMMTNATVVSAVKGVDGQTVTVTYKGGEKKIEIPANVPVVEVVKGNKDRHCARCPGICADRTSIGWLLARRRGSCWQGRRDPTDVDGIDF